MHLRQWRQLHLSCFGEQDVATIIEWWGALTQGPFSGRGSAKGQLGIGCAEQPGRPHLDEVIDILDCHLGLATLDDSVVANYLDGLQGRYQDAAVHFGYCNTIALASIHRLV